ncbi:uncharacterized protein LOC101851026 isoform X2 [Aplysia californica]|uniref:Uncharacterized protein LOC101851026 isoform X2 n=1 Tax=Aplysia californica TaxID=6500 RepID=A0ABM1VQI5_APLCA|nr:uncharacterized protein LOC101851026 isoform X2 [Aplysia californica]
MAVHMSKGDDQLKLQSSQKLGKPRNNGEDSPTEPAAPKRTTDGQTQRNNDNDASLPKTSAPQNDAPVLKDESDQESKNLKADLERELLKLDLNPQNLLSCMKLLTENQNLCEAFMSGVKSVIHLRDGDKTQLEKYLQILNEHFHSATPKNRTLLADFVAHLNFCEDSYKISRSILDQAGLVNFNDTFVVGLRKMLEVDISCLTYLRYHWWNFSDSSTKFAAGAATVGILKELVQDIVNLVGTDGKKLRHSLTFETAIGTLHNMAKLPDLRQMFRDLEVVTVLGHFLDYKEETKVTMLVLLTLSLIIDEDQNHLLISHDAVLDLVIMLTVRAWKLSEHRYDGFSAEELIQGLSGFSRNDEIKKLLVNKGVLSLVLTILTTGDEKEIEAGANLLWQLSFDEENKSKIKDDKELMEAIETLSRKSSNKKITRALQGTLWVLKMGKREIEAPHKKKKLAQPDSSTTSSNLHIMISYNWSDQKKLIEVRDSLKSRGYNMWMDIDNLSGSTLQGMAEAVEQSEIVLVCMSEKYKESPNCRSEAEYAFSLQKPIIPLLMQLEYKPDGWLGILLGTKLFFNFSGKYPFEEKINDLVKEIGQRGKLLEVPSVDHPDGAIVKASAALVSSPPQSSASDSATLNVVDWITENKLGKYACLRSLTSEQLLFLKKLSSRAPEFYYSFILDLLSGKVSESDLAGLIAITGAVEKIKISR